MVSSFREDNMVKTPKNIDNPLENLFAKKVKLPSNINKI